ncbi:MAG: hypothetical protein L6302_06295 [Desulfobacteraceae bacterium]|nr:hypothetical protein [Desulfobacteraceae bacterium]
MEVRLHYTVRAVHGAECPYMKNFVITACVKSSAGTFPDKVTFISSQKKYFFPFLNRIIGTGNYIINFTGIIYDNGRNFQA